MGIDKDKFVEIYPRLYHMAHRDSLKSIVEHGLLSTSALLDLYEISGNQRIALEKRHRPNYVAIHNPVHGTAWIRDQKPMSDAGLVRALGGTMSPEQWYCLLNSKVFFWTSERRLNTLLQARAYKNDEHLVFEVNTASLVDAHWKNVELCHMNSGCTLPFPHSRSAEIFLPPSEYDFDERRRVKPAWDAVVEVTVNHSVPDFMQHVISYRTRTGSAA